MFNFHFLIAIHTIFLIAIFFTLIKSYYEDRFFGTLVSKYTNYKMTQEEGALSLLHISHDLAQSNYVIRDESDLYMRKALFDFLHPRLLKRRIDCGDFTLVLALALQRYGLNVRIAQMKNAKKEGAHILLEAKIGDSWVVLDPKYDLAFIRPDGRLASFNDVKQNWEYFKKQVPLNYNMSYRYEDV